MALLADYTTQSVHLIVLIFAFLLGIVIGRFARPDGQDHIDKLRFEKTAAEIITDIEAERLKQDQMLRERMQ